MRPEHPPVNDPCDRCGQSAKSHRQRKRKRGAYFRSYNKKHREDRHCKQVHRNIIGIDGEGFESGSVYAYIAAWNRNGQVEEDENLQGLSTQECLEFLLRLPASPLKFGFSLGYDYTKWLQDLDNESLYSLNHPEERMDKKGPPKPVFWSPDGGENTYALNLLSGRFSVAKVVIGKHKRHCQARGDCIGCKTSKSTVVWDCFKFFQSSFIAACLAWDVITKEEFETLKEMKGKRSGFERPQSGVDEEWTKVKHYCGLECRKMAELATRLLRAHDDAGLKLKQYYGAGSTGAAMLEKMQARKYMQQASKKEGENKVTWRAIEYHPHLLYALACAFFGGRFEISRRGPVREPCWSYDISSAYPYAFTFLPCLIHGEWRYLHNPKYADIERARAAVVQYELPPYSGIRCEGEKLSSIAWGPFPFRVGEANDDIGAGNIVYPVSSEGGWLHRDEFLAGARHYPNVKLKTAWVFHVDCSCPVLSVEMPKQYKLRLSWGKEGRGQVTKLGMNSCYGKAAQTKGKRPPYQNFVWAGMTTASCRAQLLDAMATARDPYNILMVATDGIVSAEPLSLATPKDTSTFDALDIKTGKSKPLGGWEEKKIQDGMFLIRPGIAFPLAGDAKEEEGKARGIGKAVLRTMRQKVLESWERNGAEPLEVTRPMFFGMKSMIRKVGDEYRRGDLYGKFANQVVKVDYHPFPKRPAVGENERLLTWMLDGEMSNPYGPILGRKKVESELVRQLREERELMLDQPDADDGFDEREF